MKKYMKKITSLKIAAVVLGFMVAIPAFASTGATLAPSTVHIAPGATVTLTVTVAPSTNNYAEKIELKYPADLLEAVSFTPASGWMPLTQSGYDSMDNTTGILVKTAGYPDGLSSPTAFGTVTFRAKKEGTAQVAFGANSTSFELNTQTPMTGTGATVIIAAAPVAPAGTTLSSATNLAGANETASTTPTTDLSASAIGAGFHFSWLWIIGLIILLIFGYITLSEYNRRKKEIGK